MHIELDLSRPLAQAHIDSNLATIIGAVFGGIGEQFIQS
jgi:hypothetical protein